MIQARRTNIIILIISIERTEKVDDEHKHDD